MKGVVFACNSLWVLSCYPSYLRFLRGCEDLKKTQTSILLRIIKRNRDTEIGRLFGFEKINSPEDYRKKVPLTSYKFYAPYIEKICRGEKQVLTREKVLLLEPTGGSTAPSKLIPYTPSLHREFLSGISPWIYTLYTKRPGLLAGKSYWAITSLSGYEKRCRVPVGFREDTSYLGNAGKFFISPTLAVPSSTILSRNLEEALYLTAFYLLREENLVLISVWSPSFLLLLLERIKKYREKLLSELRKFSPHRARWVEKCLDRERYHLIWKKLSLISCWTQGWASRFLPELKRVFPGVEIQGKGLIATEGFVTFPWRDGYVLSVNSHFFEFLKNGESYFAWELREGEKYSVIITTGGGLYRYMLGDVVEVTGFYKGVPMLEFVEKEMVCDMVGEKLNAFHVEKSIKEALDKFSISSSFYFLAPDEDKGKLFYTLFIETDNIPQGFVDFLERKLSENYHYRYARKLGQLAPLRVFLIEKGGMERYIQRKVKSGKKLGDIKPMVLEKEKGWRETFRGKFLKE